jgi:hypothetical protein
VLTVRVFGGYQFTCQIQFIDFMGLSDSSSVKKLLQQTNPKRCGTLVFSMWEFLCFV